MAASSMTVMRQGCNKNSLKLETTKLMDKTIQIRTNLLPFYYFLNEIKGDFQLIQGKYIGKIQSQTLNCIKNVKHLSLKMVETTLFFMMSQSDDSDYLTENSTETFTQPATSSLYICNAQQSKA